MIIEHCYSPVRRKCLDNLENVDSDGVGGTFCKVMFETDCRTVYSMAQHKQKSLPQTICKRLPKTLCGGNNCEFVQVFCLIIFKYSHMTIGYYRKRNNVTTRPKQSLERCQRSHVISYQRRFATM